MIYLGCDNEACDSMARQDGVYAAEFLTLSAPEVVGREGFVRHFCSVDYVMRWAAANSVPTEEVSI